MLLFKERMMTQLHFIQMVQTRLNNRSVQIGSAQTSVQFATVHLSLCLHTNHRKTFKYVWDIISFGWFECKQRHYMYVEDYFLHIATSLFVIWPGICICFCNLSQRKTLKLQLAVIYCLIISMLSHIIIIVFAIISSNRTLIWPAALCTLLKKIWNNRICCHVFEDILIPRDITVIGWDVSKILSQLTYIKQKNDCRLLWNRKVCHADTDFTWILFLPWIKSNVRTAMHWILAAVDTCRCTMGCPSMTS